MLVFNPGEQARFSTFEKQCYRGIAPTLSEVTAVYGYKTTKAWMMAQLFNLSEFTNKRNILSNDLIEELSELIINRYHYLKLTEMMLFFFRLKNSDYEEFFGEVSTMMITRSLKTFLRDRNIAHEKYDNEDRAALLEKEIQNGISREEYEKGVAEGRYKRYDGT